MHIFVMLQPSVERAGGFDDDACVYVLRTLGLLLRQMLCTWPHLGHFSLGHAHLDIWVIPDMHQIRASLGRECELVYTSKYR